MSRSPFNAVSLAVPLALQRLLLLLLLTLLTCYNSEVFSGRISLTHARAHTHTHSLSLLLSLSFFLSLFRQLQERVRFRNLRLKKDGKVNLKLYSATEMVPNEAWLGLTI